MEFPQDTQGKIKVTYTVEMFTVNTVKNWEHQSNDRNCCEVLPPDIKCENDLLFSWYRAQIRPYKHFLLSGIKQ